MSEITVGLFTLLVVVLFWPSWHNFWRYCAENLHLLLTSIPLINNKFQNCSFKDTNFLYLTI